MRVHELMTPEVLTVSADTRVDLCLDLMRQHGYRTLPVVDAANKPLGLLGEARAAAAAPGSVAADVMSETFVSTRPQEPVYDALNRCTWAMQDAVLVVENGVLVGILAEYDAVKQAALLLPSELRVEDYASTTLLCIDQSRPAHEALERMERAWVKAMVVLDERRLVGIVGHRECISARVDSHPEITVGSLLSGARSSGFVFWDTPLRDAAQLAVDDAVGCVPVVSDDGLMRVEAVLSRGDIVRALLASGAVGEADLSFDGG